MTRKIKRTMWLVIACVVSAIVIAALTVGNSLCFANFNVVTAFLHGQGFKDDSESATAAREINQVLAANVEEQGAVLLQNKNNSLPISKGTKVNVFGWAGCDNGFIPQGTGSGTGSRNDMVTLLGGLKEAGLSYNETLANDYNALSYRRVAGGSYVIEAYSEALYKDYYGVAEAPNSFIDSHLTQAKEYSDTAIIVLGRLLGEGNDYSKIQYIQDGANNTSRKLQSISEREEYMVQKVCENFSNVILIINATNPMELGFVKQYNIGSVIYMGTPGTRGTIGLGRLLVGDASPSGHVVDTWAYDLSTAASYATSGREGVGSYLDISSDTSLGTRANKYTDYLEDIYVGYKWYETADEEGFWNSEYAKQRWGLTNGYSDVVQYPFGFGLSYTKFDWEIESASFANNATITQYGKIEITVRVTNTGTVKGMDVVQLYYKAPYTKGGIEKSSVVLGAFAKTTTLEPGQFELVKLRMNVEDMKSYDCYDRNNNGFMGYELEGGDYELTLRTDSHTLKTMARGTNKLTYKVPANGWLYENDSRTGNTVENQFTNYTNSTSGASSSVNERAIRNAHSVDGNDEPTKIKYMTRNNFLDTFPKETPANRNAGTIKNDVHYVNVTPVNFADAHNVTFGSRATDWTIQDLFGAEYEDEMWDELVSQLTLDECALLITKGGFGTIELSKIGKPKTTDTDGPAGFNNSVIGQNNLKAVNYPSDTVIAQTWDWYVAYQVGNAIGIEGTAIGIQGWYGPGGNLHRTVLGGRNFEYYSEDPLVAGTMLAYEVNGAKEQGVTAYIKHIAVNETDSGRNGAYKWLTEQNLRENYLRVFEIAVKIGGANAMMSSVDRIGGTRASSSYAMLTAVLRNEWGFRGTVITDYYQCAGSSNANQTIHDVDECVRAGNSQLLYPDGGSGWFDDTSTVTSKMCIFNSAKDILYTYADTINYSETAQGLEKGSSIGTRTGTEVFPYWVIWLVILDVLMVGLAAFWVTMTTIAFVRARKQGFVEVVGGRRAKKSADKGAAAVEISPEVKDILDSVDNKPVDEPAPDAAADTQPAAPAPDAPSAPVSADVDRRLDSMQSEMDEIREMLKSLLGKINADGNAAPPEAPAPDAVDAPAEPAPAAAPAAKKPVARKAVAKKTSAKKPTAK